MRFPTWELLAPATSPDARSNGFGFAYDKVRDECVLYGGYLASGDQSTETWVWDGIIWTQKFPGTTPTTAPPAGSQPPTLMCWDAVNDQILLVTNTPGVSGNAFETWTWDGTDWAQLFPANDPGTDAVLCGLCEAPGIGNVLVFGGAGDGTGSSRTWLWDGTDWTEQFPPTTPQKSHSPSLTFDALRDKVVRFGGRHNGSVIDASTWTWDGTDWTHESVTTAPPHRDQAGFAFSGSCRFAVLFGGGDTTGAVTHLWDGGDWFISTAISPTWRRGSANLLTYDEARGEIVMFGGNDVSDTFDETWRLTCSDGAAINHTFGLGR